MPQPKILCVVGPTACGKTKVGVLLARRYNGEVVSVDSMQIYRGMTIGTAAPTSEETEGIPHHMVAVADPAEKWSVARFTEAADACIQDILRRINRLGAIPQIRDHAAIRGAENICRGQAEQFLSLFHRHFGCNQRTAPQGRMHHKNSLGDPGHQPVTHREIAPVYRRTGRQLRNQCAAAFQHVFL